LFTDLEVSTRLWERYPDDMKVALARHDELVRSAIESHRGHVVKATGDGFHGVFHTAHDAIDAALVAQTALSTQAWPETGALRVRMGLHTGEIELRGDGVAGVAVHIGARVAQHAGAAEVLVSSTVKDLVAGSDI
jgi:class 3 adenylate cyclase